MNSNIIIYIYTTPEMKKNGYVKIGQTSLRKNSSGITLTEKESVEERIKEQIYGAADYNTSSRQEKFEILFFENSFIEKKSSYFRDIDIHNILKNYGYQCWKDKSYYKDSNGIKKQRDKNITEIFKISVDIVKNIFNKLKNDEEIIEEDFQIKRIELNLRNEQKKIINETKQYFSKHKKEYPNKKINYLWFLKMGFGKTISSYQFIKDMKFNKTIIVTYIPSVENSWEEDIKKFKGFEDYIFISSIDKKNNDKDYIEKQLRKGKKVIFFLSFQKINSDYKNKNDYLKDIFSIDWDLLIKEEYHYGVHNNKSKKITDNNYSEIEDDSIFSEEENNLAQEIIKEEDKIKTNNILCLSGTPFNVLKNGEFSEEQISKFDYIEEQKIKKEELSKLSEKDKLNSPYYKIPKMKIFNFDLNEKVGKFLNSNNEFSISYFFKAENSEFISDNVPFINYFIKSLYESTLTQIEEQQENIENIILNNNNKNISKKDKSFNIFNLDNDFIDNKYLEHSLWLLPSIESCCALEKILIKDPFFKDFNIINVNKKEYGNGVSVVNKVKEEILKSETEHKKTITLSFQKLGVGVNIPQWGSVLFLNDMKSEQSYFQYAFRCQRGYNYPLYDNYGVFNGTQVKTECYVFDFNYLRSFQMYESFNINSSNNENKQEETMEDLNKYLPILSLSKAGYIKEYSIEDIFNKIEQSYSLLSGEEYQRKFNKSLIFNENIENSFKLNPELLELINKIKIDKNKNDIKGFEFTEKEEKKIKKLKNQKSKNNSERKEEEKLEEKNKKLIIEKLKIIYSRIPLSIYLSKNNNTCLYSIIESFEEEEFQVIFKMNKKEFEKIIEITNLNVQEINRFIRQFHKLEKNNFNIINYKE